METLDILLILEQCQNFFSNSMGVVRGFKGEEIFRKYNDGIAAAIGLIQEQGERLAAYESTGLEPETIKAAADSKNAILTLASLFLDTTAGRLRELVQADQDGRLAITPCKVGDIVYQVTEGVVSEFKVRFIEVSTCGCLFLHADLRVGTVFTGTVFSEDEIGKTVFLTREEAERCLD